MVDFFDQEYTDWVTREDIDNYSQMLFDQLQRCIENVKAEAGSSFDIVLFSTSVASTALLAKSLGASAIGAKSSYVQVVKPIAS